MTNQGHPKVMPEPEPLALTIATKSAFLACRTSNDARTPMLAQHEAENSRLQELYHAQTVELAEKEAQFLELKRSAADTRAAWAERSLDLQRAADAARLALAHCENQHAHLQERHRERVAELECKEAEVLDLGHHHQERVIELERQNSHIRDLEDTTRSLAQKHSDAVRSSSAQHEAEIAHHQERYRTQSVELEQKEAHILHLGRTINSLTQEHNDLKDSAAGCQEALAGKTRDLQAVTDEDRLTSSKHEHDQMLLQRLHRKQTDELQQKEAQILERQSNIEDLQKKNSDLESTAASAQKALAVKTSELQRITDAASSSSAQHEVDRSRLQQLLEEQSAGTKRNEALIRDLQYTVEDLANKNSNLEWIAAGAKDAVAEKHLDLERATDKLSAMENAKAAADQHVARLSSTVETLETDVRRLTKQLNVATRTQARTDSELKNALRLASKSQATIDGLKRDSAQSSKKLDSLQGRRDFLATTLARTNDAHAKTKRDLQDATKTISQLRTAKATATVVKDMLEARLQQVELDHQALRRERMRPTQHSPAPVTGLPVQLYHNQNTPSVAAADAFEVRDNSDLYDWDTARAFGIFDFWANSLHGSEIMQLISIEAGLPHLVDCMLELIFDHESQHVVPWLVHQHWCNLEPQRLHIVHLLNDCQGLYGCACHQVHIFPNSSRDQDIHIRHVLELLRVDGTPEDVNAMFAAILSCFSGRDCLELLQRFGIPLNNFERDLLSQKCYDKGSAFSV